MLNLQRRLTSDIFPHGIIEFLDPENMGLAVEIASLSSLEPEISIIAMVVAILDFRLPVTSDSIPDITIEFLDPENMRVAVGILSLSYIAAEIWGGGSVSSPSGSNVTIFHPAVEG